MKRLRPSNSSVPDLGTYSDEIVAVGVFDMKRAFHNIIWIFEKKLGPTTDGDKDEAEAESELQ